MSQQERRAAERAGGRLALALAGGLAVATAAVPLALLVRSAWPPLVDADAAASRDAEQLVAGSGALLSTARVVTLAGDPWLLWVLVLVVAGLLARSGFGRLALFLLAVRFGAQLLSTGLKAAVDRSRPVFDEPVGTALGAAFPSGHALGAAAVYTALAVVVLPLVARRWWTALLAGAAVLAVLVAVSRVLLGVHYVSDVAGGLLLGAGWMAVCAAVLAEWRAEERRPVDDVELVDDVEFHSGEAR